MELNSEGTNGELWTTKLLVVDGDIECNMVVGKMSTSHAMPQPKNLDFSVAIVGRSKW